MGEKKINVGESVYVSESNPGINSAHLPFIAVGSSRWVPFSNCAAQHKCCRAENIGLLQFPGFNLPPGCETLNVQLGLFVSSLQCGTRHIQIYPNNELFTANSVNWMTRPGVEPVPIADLHVERPGIYVYCDITQFIKENNPLPDNNWGFSLVTVEQCRDGMVLFSRQAGFQPYIFINYIKKIFPPCPYETARNLFRGYFWEIDGNEPILYSPDIEVANARIITFFVENAGTGSFNANLQISPDGINFIDDKQIRSLQAGATEAITPYLFAKYMRVRIQPEIAGQFVNARIWCQIQTYDYLLN